LIDDKKKQHFKRCFLSFQQGLVILNEVKGGLNEAGWGWVIWGNFWSGVVMPSKNM
jgi:hypothetical protein